MAHTKAYILQGIQAINISIRVHIHTQTAKDTQITAKYRLQEANNIKAH